MYDAINVLLAMDIIQREKKDILWKGLPTMRSPSGGGAAAAAAAGPQASQGGAGGAQAAAQPSAEAQELLAERQRLMDTVDRKQAYLEVRHCLASSLSSPCSPFAANV